MIRLVCFLVIIAVIAAAIVGIARQYRKEHPKPKPLDDVLPSKARSSNLAPQAVPLPSQAPAAATRGSEAAGAWEALRDLLAGKGATEQERRLGSDGRFNTQAGLRYTIYHGDGVCVVVCARSVGHPKVVRTICNMNERWVAQVEEPRLVPGSGDPPGITSGQALNVETAGLTPLDTDGILFFTLDVRLAYRVGTL